MSYSVVIFLGILQGITEFFPISSSGHLLLAESFLHLPVADLQAFDVVLHGGTLAALLVLFWREWLGILRFNKAGRNFFLQLVAATIPAALVGVFLGDWMEEATRGENHLVIVGSFFICVAILFFCAEKFSKHTSEKVGWRQVVFMGLAQAVALLPGVSRSGSTIALGMFAGLKREVAARFSFLMLAPVTFGAVVLIAKEFADGKVTLPPTNFVIVGFLVSALTSYFAAEALLRFIKKHSLNVFGIYLLIAAGVLFWLAN
jgi:undecaprenyl-diphosphatase